MSTWTLKEVRALSERADAAAKDKEEAERRRADDADLSAPERRL